MAATITALAAAVRALAGSRCPEEAPWPGGPWQERSVVELRALLRALPEDRRSLPAPIEKLRRADLYALRPAYTC